MVIVIVMGLGMIWGVIYLITELMSGIINQISKNSTPKRNIGLISIIIMDILIFMLCCSSAGSVGFCFAIAICLVLDLAIADGLAKTSTPQNIRKTNQQTKKEDKEHNDWGYIDWEEKNR